MTTTKAPAAPRFDSVIYTLTIEGHWHPARLYRNLTEQQARDLYATEGGNLAAFDVVAQGIATRAVSDLSDTRRIGVAVSA